MISKAIKKLVIPFICLSIIFTSLGATKVSAASGKDPKPVKISTSKGTTVPILDFSKDNEKTAGWYTLTFGPDVKTLTVPIKIKENGGLAYTLKDNNLVDDLTVGLYKDKSAKKAIKEELSSSGGLADCVYLKKGTYYLKFSMDRFFNSSDTLNLDFQLLLVRSKGITLKEGQKYYTYLNKSKLTYKLEVAKPSYITFTLESYGNADAECDLTILDSSKKEIGQAFRNLYVKKGTYYFVITNSTHGTATIGYTTTPITIPTNTDKTSAKKLTINKAMDSMFLLTDEANKEYWYVSDLTADTDIYFDTSGFGSFQFDLINQNGEVVKSDVVEMGSSTLMSFRKDAGTYYIKITKSEDCKGTYSIKLMD